MPDPVKGFHSFEKGYENLLVQKDFDGFLIDFSRKQKDFCYQRGTRFLESKKPLDGINMRHDETR